MNSMVGTISRRIKADGFAMPFKAFDEAEARCLLAEYKAACDTVADHKVLGAIHTIFKPHLIWLWADAIAHNEGILDVVEEVLGKDVLIWSMDVFMRPPQAVALDIRAPERGDEIAPTGLDWHQDSLYLGLEPIEEVVRVWLALTPTTLDNGTMRYLRGSHAGGTQAHTYPDPASGFAHRGPRLDINIPEGDVVPVCLRPGNFAIHDIRTVHDSGANTTEMARVSIAVTYMSGRVRSDRALSVLPARGCAGSIAFEREQRPTRDLAPEGVKAFIHAIQARIRHMTEEGVPDVIHI